MINLAVLVIVFILRDCIIERMVVIKLGLISMLLNFFIKGEWNLQIFDFLTSKIKMHKRNYMEINYTGEFWRDACLFLLIFFTFSGLKFWPF